MFGFSKKKGPQKLLLTSLGFSGTFHFLSILAGLKKSMVAWRGSEGIAYFNPDRIQDEHYIIRDECLIAANDELTKKPLTKIYTRMIERYESHDLYSIGHWDNLHGFLSKYGARYFRKNNIKLINLIRHPIDRTHSNWYGLRAAFSGDIAESHRQGFLRILSKHRQWLDGFLRSHNVSLDDMSHLAFVGSCLNIFACSVDASYKNHHHVLIEQVSEQSVVSLLNDITGVGVKFEINELQPSKVIKNSHVDNFNKKQKEVKQEDKVSMSSYDKFSSWLPWQQELYKQCVMKSKLNKTYSRFNYELYI